MTIAIIAGGRGYQLGPAEHAWLDTFGIRGVVSGGASGADQGGEQWAVSRGIPVACFEADWKTHGRAAGPLRNQQMANFLLQYPQRAVLLFPGGAGTASMRNIAKKAGIPVYEFSPLTPRG